MLRINEKRRIKWHETCKCRLDASVCKINIVGIMINVDSNVKNWLTKEYVIKDLFGIVAIVNMNVINYMMLENILIMKFVNAEKKLVDKLVEESSENIAGNEMIHSYYENVCNS